MFDAVESEVGAGLIRRVKLHPHCNGQLVGGKSEGDNEGGGGGLAVISEVQVIVDRDRLHTTLSCQVERTFAVEVIGQVDAGGGSWAVSGQAVVDIDVAVFSLVSRRTDARVALSLVDTCGSVLASSSSTGVVLILTTDACVVFAARAVEAVAQVPAGSSIHARVTDASLGRRLTPFAISAGRTGAEEVLEEVDAECIVLARGLVALLLVLLTPLAHPADGASALEVANKILTLPTIAARICRTVINIGLATFTLVTVPALALKSIVQIKALQGSRGITGPGAALVLLHLAGGRANEAWPASALEAVDGGLASATVLARLVNAVVNFVLAVGPSIAKLTDTGVAIHLGNV